MALIGIFSTNDNLNRRIQERYEQESTHRFTLNILKDENSILEFLNYDLPEVVILNLSDDDFSYASLLEQVRNDSWLHNFGIIGLYDSALHDEEGILKELKDINILALLDYTRVPSHIVKLVDIIEMNKQLIFQRELAENLVEDARGSFMVENDILAVSIYAGIAATMLAQRGLIDPDSRMHLQLCLAELLVNGIEHGNCGISYEEKSAFLAKGYNIVDLVARKCEDPRIAAKRVFFEWEITADKTRFVVRDEGNGFDVGKLKVKLQKEGDWSLHGRGIKMARALASRLVYNRKGNEVTLYIDHKPVEGAVTPTGFRSAEVVQIQKGDIIFREGESSDFLYYISSGNFSVFHKGKHVGALSTRDIFMGEMSFLLNNRRSATVRAEESGKLVKISRKQFVSVVKQNPHYGIFLSKLLARKLTRANASNARRAASLHARKLT